MIKLQLQWISYYIKKQTFYLKQFSEILKFQKISNLEIVQIVFVILKHKNEHFCILLEKEIFPKHAIFAES